MIEKEIRDCFEQGEEGIWVLNQPSMEIEAMYFDFDGILIKESNLHEMAYAWMVCSVKKGDFDLTYIPNEEEVAFAVELRVHLKGLSPSKKLNYLLSHFNPSLSLSHYELNEYWMLFIRTTIKAWYGQDYHSYLQEGGADFLKACNQDMICYGLTANYLPQAKWLMSKVHLSTYFEEILAYPLEANDKLSKEVLMREHLQQLGMKGENVCMIGDGVPDIYAGKNNGAYTIGVGNSLDNALRVLGAKPDIMLTSMRASQQLIEVMELG